MRLQSATAIVVMVKMITSVASQGGATCESETAPAPWSSIGLPASNPAAAGTHIRTGRDNGSPGPAIGEALSKIPGQTWAASVEGAQRELIAWSYGRPCPSHFQELSLALHPMIAYDGSPT